MEFIVWVETPLGGKRLEIQEVSKVERAATEIGPEELGLTLADGKTVLKQVQERIVQNLFEARRKIAAWRIEYNEERPHSSLGYHTPKEFAAAQAAGFYTAEREARDSNGVHPWVETAS